MVGVPLQEELIVTQDGRFFIKSCRLRDHTGGVYVDVVASAVPALYGCKTEAELKDQLATQSLTSLKTRVNARGVLRVENGVTKKYVTQVEPTPEDWTPAELNDQLRRLITPLCLSRRRQLICESI